MTNLEKRLDAKAELMMRKLDELLSSSNPENCSGPRENSRQAADGFRAPRHAKNPPRSRTNLEPNHRERPRAAAPRAGWTDPITPEAEATSGARLPTVPHVMSFPELTTILHDTTMCTSM